MRLTLRTLLAWIDGVLPEPQRDEIGAKVEASPVAGKLVSRIADVVARPGLSAPRPDGRGLAEDPNTAAEFLDNVLPGDRLEAFERVCIDSDIHLAEIADCHTLLAELSRDPEAAGLLDPALRQRLLASVARQANEQPAAHEEAAALVKAVKEAVAGDEKSPRSHTPSRPASPVGRSEQQPRASLAAWLSAGVAALLLVAAGVLLVRSIWPTTPRREVAAAGKAAEPRPAAAVAAPAAAPPAAAPAPPAAPPAALAPPAQPVEPRPAPPDEPPPVAALPAVPPPPVPQPPVDRVVGPGVAVPLPQMDRAGDGPEPGPDDEQPEAEPADPRPAAPAPFGMLAEGGVALRRVREGEAAGWERLAGGDELGQVEEIVVPIHAYPRLVRGDISIQLQPGTQAAITTDANGTPRLEVVFGGAVVWTEADEATVGITAAGLSGVVTLGPRQPVGVAVELLRSPGDDPAIVSPGQRASLFTEGGVGWRQTELDGTPSGQPLSLLVDDQPLIGNAVDQPLPPRCGLQWTSADPTAVKLLPAAPPPPWLKRVAPATRLDRDVAATLATRLADQEPAVEALRAMARDRRVENRMAAAATLALLGDYGPLVDLLCDEQAGGKLRDGMWENLEAATVPLALARGANAAAALRQALLDRGPAGRGDELYWLARGLAPADWPQAGGGVVAALEDTTLVVRRYAFLNLQRLFPDQPDGRLDYRPDRSPSLNERGVAWWRRKAEAGAAGPPAAPSP
jgi:hypothetical protein